jgi:hypothetical protein
MLTARQQPPTKASTAWWSQEHTTGSKIRRRSGRLCKKSTDLRAFASPPGSRMSASTRLKWQSASGASPGWQAGVGRSGDRASCRACRSTRSASRRGPYLSSKFSDVAGPRSAARSCVSTRAKPSSTFPSRLPTRCSSSSSSRTMVSIVSGTFVYTQVGQGLCASGNENAGEDGGTEGCLEMSRDPGHPSQVGRAWRPARQRPLD